MIIVLFIVTKVHII